MQGLFYLLRLSWLHGRHFTDPNEVVLFLFKLNGLLSKKKGKEKKTKCKLQTNYLFISQVIEFSTLLENLNLTLSTHTTKISF